MVRIIALTLFACISLDAFAQGVLVNATVTQVRVDQSGLGMVVFSSSLGGTPASCVISAYANALAFDSNTAGGKAILALALTAKTTGTPLAVVYGTGACAIYNNNYVEDWSYGQ